MVPELQVWLIFFLPLGSFLAIAVIIRPFLNRYSSLAGYITVLAIGLSFLLSLIAFRSVSESDSQISYQSHSWLELGDLSISIGVLLDPLTAIMLVAVTGVSLMVQVYSLGYMAGDSSYARYFAYMSLFTASMVGIVIASNIIQLYVFWELVGLCSYLLIGFWHQRPAAAAAAKKAFIVTRLGDFGFLVAILYLFFHQGSISEGGNGLDISVINEAARTGLIATSVVTWIALGIFAGAIGKSGQFPLHTWLPDAMEGPTPVSALIHAATMVAAGVFLVARFFPLFEESTVAMNTVAIVGGFTALFAATMGLVAYDIKRVLAYSTISQLGYMMLALGIGAIGPAIFHLFTHAFFKALLFLGAGNVGHATGTFDMRFMGGLRKVMPWTYYTFLTGSLSLAAIFPVAGFWSKDEILASAFGREGPIGQVVAILASVTVVLTVLYIGRVLVMTFEGKFKGGADADHSETHGGGVHLGESPLIMVLPVLALAVPAVFAGIFVNSPWDIGIVPIHGLSHFLHVDATELNVIVFAASTIITPVIFVMAIQMYRARWMDRFQGFELIGVGKRILTNKYYMDELYEGIITGRVFYRGLAVSLDWFDRAVVDGVVRLIDRFGRNIGRGIALVQAGQLQGYGIAISLGVLSLFGFFMIWR